VDYSQNKRCSLRVLMAIHNSISPLNDRGGRRPLIKHPRKLLDRGKSRSKQRGCFKIFGRHGSRLSSCRCRRRQPQKAGPPEIARETRPNRGATVAPRTPTEGPTCSGGCAGSSYRARRRTCAIRPSPPSSSISGPLTPRSSTLRLTSINSDLL
jgi:hypothetical protein